MLCDPAQYLWNFCGLKRPGSDGKTEPGGVFPAGVWFIKRKFGEETGITLCRSALPSVLH